MGNGMLFSQLSIFNQSQRAQDYGLYLALFLLYVWQLGGTPLFDVDEGAFAEASREMMLSKDWLHTTLQGVDRFDKPILVYWLQTVFLYIFGINEWSVRLPSAICTFITAIYVGHFIGQRTDLKIGWSVSFAISTSLGFLTIGRAATADGLLNMLLAFILLTLWHYVETKERKLLLFSYLWMGLGLLAKGPVAILIPIVTLFIWSVFQDKGKTFCRAAFDPIGWFIVIAVASPWYLYAWNRHGDAFIQGFFIKHNISRFSGAMESHGGNPFYYLTVWPILCLPWSVLILAVLLRIKLLWKNPFHSYCLVWSIFVFVFFSFSGTKLPHYMLYGTIPMILLMMIILPTLSEKWYKWILSTQIFVCVFFIALPWIVIYQSHLIRHILYKRLVESAAAPVNVTYSLLFTLTVILCLMFRGGFSKITRLMIPAYLISLVFVGFVVPWWASTLQGPVRDLANISLGIHGKIVQYGLNQPSFSFYRKEITNHDKPLAGDWIFLPEHRMHEFNYLSNNGNFLINGFALIQLPPESK